MFDSCVIGNKRFAPARFAAHMAGYTHSAFRRVVAELGGCGALWTEMLAARQILSENFQTSPWLRRRPQESLVFFQLMAGAGDPLDRVLDRLGGQGIEAIDLNLACNARSIRSCLAGSALFEDLTALRTVMQTARRHWPGLLTAKIRLGRQRPDWQARFIERIRLLADVGVDAIILHPRFFEDKFKRRARQELIPWAASLTRVPLIANGDLTGPEQVKAQAQHLGAAQAIMIGRMAVVRPWIFAAWNESGAVDLTRIWRRILEAILEDFAPAIALRRIKMFTKYFSANFLFRHQFYVDVSNAPTLEEVSRRAEAFLSRSPALVTHPSVAGL
jgi:tRNA-dihydrouridine synthase B